MNKKIALALLILPLLISANNPRIFEEIKKGNIPFVKQCIKDGTNLNIKDQQGNTPLHTAAEHGHERIVKKLLINADNLYFWERWFPGWFSNYPTVDDQNNDGETALHKAKDYQIADQLIRHQASLNIRNRQNLTPLLKASKEGKDELALYFMNIIEDYDKHTAEGNNVLHLAILNNHSDLAARIIAFNNYAARSSALLNAPNNKRETPIFNAVALGNIPLVKALLPVSTNKTSTTTYGDSLLTRACKNNNPDDMVKTLLEDPEVRAGLHKNNQQTPLYVILKSGNVPLAQELIFKYGASINQKDSNGNSVLMLSLKDKNPHITDWLLQHNADLNVSNNAGETPLSIAAFQENKPLVETLVYRGACLNQKLVNGATVLMQIIAGGKHDIAEKLITMGASTDLTDEDGNSLLHYAACHPSSPIPSFIVNRCKSKINHTNKNGATALHVAADHGNVNVIKQMLYYSPDLSIVATRKEKETPAHRALKRKQYECAKLLLDPATIFLADHQGKNPVDIILENHLPIGLLANPDLRIALMHRTNSNRESYLQIAIKKGHVAGCEFFAQPELVNKKDAHGISPLMNAARGHNTAITMTLISKKALINDQDHEGLSPLHHAIAGENTEQVKLLHRYGADIYASTRQGNNAFHYAACTGNTDIIAYLKDADPQLVMIKNGAGELPFVCAARNGQYNATIMLLQENKAELQRALSVAKTSALRNHLSQLLANRETTIKTILDTQTTYHQLVELNRIARLRINPRSTYTPPRHQDYTREQLENCSLEKQNTLLSRINTLMQQERSVEEQLQQERTRQLEAERLRQQNTAPSAPPAQPSHHASAPVLEPVYKPATHHAASAPSAPPAQSSTVAESSTEQHECFSCGDETPQAQPVPCTQCTDKSDKHICQTCFQGLLNAHRTSCPFCRKEQVITRASFEKLFNKK